MVSGLRCLIDELLYSRNSLVEMIAPPGFYL